MRIGTIKEIKDNENRVGLTPAGVKQLIEHSHEVFVEHKAGEGASYSDQEYEEAGATILHSAKEVIEKAEILVKVKEPLQSEYDLLAGLAGKTLYTYLHLSGVDRHLTLKLLEHKITGVAYETVEDEKGKLPLLTPMSEVAGVLAVQYGAEYLQKKYGGRGLSLGRIKNADLAHTVIVGGGVVGITAAKTVTGMGGRVTLFDRKEQRIEELKNFFLGYLGENLFQNMKIIKPDPEPLMEAVKTADLLIGAVLVHGAAAPKVITEEHVKAMQKGAVIVDVSIDQGGCVWGSKSTSHAHPIYELAGKLFCCVPNMPGQVPRQSTQALTTATLPYLLKMADMGVLNALKSDSSFAKGLNTFNGHITYRSVAEDLKLEDHYVPLDSIFG